VTRPTFCENLFIKNFPYTSFLTSVTAHIVN
jgi:hypothetical protein